MASAATSGLLAVPVEGPVLPYYDWGACPFECCTYREWTVNAETLVLKERRAGARVAFTLAVGEKVRGLTGVVVTNKPGLMKVLKPITLGEKPSISLQPGDLIYTLHYQGEGYDLFWFKGRTYSDQIDVREIDPEPPPSDVSLQAFELPDHMVGEG